MQGRQKLSSPLFVSGDLDKFVPQTHKLRKIAKSLDFSFIADLTKHHYCPTNGRTSIDPVVYFKMQILKYLYGIPSDRQLCDEVHVNMAYRWFLNLSIEDKEPDHSSMTKIRDRLGEELFQTVFERIVLQCKKVGLIAGKQMVSDATLIEADAAKDSLVLELKYNTNTLQVEPERISKTTHVSKTDPDAHVTTGAQHECKILHGRVDYQIKRFKIQPKEWLADRGYGHGPTYDFFC